MGLQNGQAAESKLPLLEIEESMSKLDQIDKNLKCSKEDRQELKKEFRHNKNENLDNYFNIARATEEKLQQMSDKTETTDKEREKTSRKIWRK